MYTIAVCDVEPVAMQGLRSLMESSGELRVVAAETSMTDAMEAVSALRPDVLLVDKSFGVHLISEWISALRQLRFPTSAIVWGAFISEPDAVRLLKAGASGVIRKTVSLTAMMACLRTVASGGTWVDEDLIGSPERSARARSSLTARESQIAELVERGLRNKDIGAALGISAGTVKIHLKHIFEKTGVRGRYSLAVTAMREKGALTASTM
ncbi:MAG: response regulator transcription factor [Acidobacteriia bacterium]|nr:response regulator transcription factor [Terriglobia bacterium]